VLAAELNQLLDLKRPLGKRVGGVNAKMNKISVRHEPNLAD
jgi:hypothetical protein